MAKPTIRTLGKATAIAFFLALSACAEQTEMKSTSINTAEWSAGVLDQGRVIEGANRTLIMSGQVSLTPDADAPFGVVVKHPGDMRAQFQETLNNIDLVLADAGMTHDDIIHMRFFVTDMEAGLGSFDVFMAWLGESDNRPPQSFIGVNELFLPELMIEIEATAATGGD